MNALMRGTLIVLALLLAGAAPADAVSPRIQIQRDCEDGSLEGTYSPAQIRDARENLPSDVAEYTDCVSVLRRAELNPVVPTPTATPDPSGGGGSPAASPTPVPTRAPELEPQSESDNQALAQAANAGAQPVTVGGEPVLAGITPTTSIDNPLPGPLVVALILLGLAGLALCLPPLRRRLGELQRRR